jgi:hypothetical protein
MIIAALTGPGLVVLGWIAGPNQRYPFVPEAGRSITVPGGSCKGATADRVAAVLALGWRVI